MAEAEVKEETGEADVEAGEANPRTSPGAPGTAQTLPKARVTAIIDMVRLLGFVWRHPHALGPTRSLPSHPEDPASLTEIKTKN